MSAYRLGSTYSEELVWRVRQTPRCRGPSRRYLSRASHGWPLGADRPCHTTPRQSAAGLRYSTEIGKKWGEGHGEDSRHRGETLRPDVNICDQATARSLGVATGAFRFYLPCLRQEFPDILCHSFLN